MKKFSLSAVALILALPPAVSRSQPPQIPPGKAHSQQHSGQLQFPVISPLARPKDFNPAASALVEFPVGGRVAHAHKLHMDAPAADIPASSRKSRTRPESDGEAKAFEPAVPAAAVASSARPAGPARKRGPIPECQ